MRDLLSGLLILGCLIWITRFLLGYGRGRVGRPPKGICTRLRDPGEAPVAAAVLGGYALGTAAVLVDPHADSSTAIVIGGIVAVLMAFRGIEPLVKVALGIVACICALIRMGYVVLGDAYDELAVIYRLALVGLVFFCFLLAVMVFDRASALKGERGLALLGIVDIVDFIARPAGVDMFNLAPVGHAAFLVVAAAAAFGLGWAVSEATLGIVGIAVLGLSVIFDGPLGWLGVLAALSAAGFTVIARAFTRPVGL